MLRYNTVQRENLINFLKKNSSFGMTVIDITNGMRNDPDIFPFPSVSTVYRQIKVLVEEGLVKRTVNGYSREFLYQITDNKCCRQLHMKCVKCGKLSHMNNEYSEQLIEDLFENEGFLIDRSIVLTGICRKCRLKITKREI